MPQLSLVGIEPAPEQEPEIVADFDVFWLLYPRHVAKANARKAWDKINPALHVSIIEAVAAWRPVWATKDAEFLPHAASWLNGERWDDELPRGVKVSAASHQQFAPSAPPQPKGELPAHVLAMIAKLKAQK